MGCFCIFNHKKVVNKSNSDPQLRKQTTENVSKIRVSKSANSTPRSIPELYKKRKHNLRDFTYSELSEATNEFNKLLKIGEGGFGCVYKGVVKPLDSKDSPIVVAIKKLNNLGKQGHKEWLVEVQFLGIVDHPKLVKLLGYCAVDGEQEIQRLLVYEYMAKRSLENHLFGQRFPPLSWVTRLKVMLDAAEGLAYLHEGMEVPIIFRDFKSSNVLLDKNMNGKLSDFGLARVGPIGEQTHVSTAPVGTYGYAAPEYVLTGRVKPKSDIYSFGIVLFEILTGRRTIEKHPSSTSEQRLVEWVKQYPVDGNTFHMIIDVRLKNKCPISAARKIARLAGRCVIKEPADRPDMSEIITVLNEAILESEGSFSGGTISQSS